MRLVNLLIIVGILGGIAFLAFVQPPFVVNIYWKIKGYPYADSPEQAMKLLNKAFENRKYDAACRYLEGKFRERMYEVSTIASDLGSEIDDFRYAAKDRGEATDNFEVLMQGIDPMPKSIEYDPAQIKENDDGTAVVPVVMESSSPKGPKLQMILGLRKVDGTWRVVLDLNKPLLHNNMIASDVFQYMDKYGKRMAGRIKAVNRNLKTEPTQRERLTAYLKEQIDEVMKEK